MTSTTLITPIPRKGQDDVKSVSLRKPTAGELRGAKLTDLLQMDVNALIKVLPRVTEPALLDMEVAGLDPADLLSLGGQLVGFFVTPDQQAQIEQLQH